MSAAYRRRLERDLDRWIAAGLVGADRRAAILATLPQEAPRLSAAAALGAAGAAFFGLAVIAFVAANWEALPRLARLALVLALIWAGLVGAIWADEGRPRARQALSSFAALAFAAGVGLVAQMYHLAGPPWAGLAIASLAALGLGFAAGAISCLYLGAGFSALAYFTAAGDGWGRGLDLPDLLLAALIAALFLARRRFADRAPLTHLLALAVTLAAWSWPGKLLIGESADVLRLGLLCLVEIALAAAVAVLATRRPEAPTSALALGYATWSGLAAVQGLAAFGHIGEAPNQIILVLHALLALGAGVGAVAWARARRHAWAAAGGVVFTIVAALLLMSALALDLLVIAATLSLAALAAVAAAFVVARRRSAAP